MIIEIGNTEHMEQIQKIAETTWAVTYGDLLSEEQIAYMLDMMYSEKALTEQMTRLGHHFFVIRQDNSDHWQGFVSYEFDYKGQPKTKLHKLYVLPECHGTGMGKILVNKVREEARTNNNALVTLNMNRDNKTKDFYEHVGFRIVGEEDIDIGNGFLMEDYIFEIDA